MPAFRRRHAIAIGAVLAATIALAAALVLDLRSSGRSSGSDNAGGPGPFVLTDPNAPFTPVIASTEVAVGEPRLLLRALGRSGASRFPAGSAFTVRFFEPLPGGVRFRADHPATILTEAPPSDPLYAVTPPFDVPGDWALELRVTPPGGPAQVSARLPLTVRATSRLPAIGAPAPPADTLTSADAPLPRITTAPDPDPALYAASLEDALAQGRPLLIVFTSPARCPLPDLCTRAIAQVRDAAAAAGLLAIHADPYVGYNTAGGLYPDGAPYLDTWGLRNDPWIIAIDAHGIVRARWELAVADADLRAAVAALAG